MAKKKNVIVSLWMHSCAGQRHLAGVFRYIARGCDWDVQLCRMGEVTLKMLDAVDGVITSPHMNADMLARIRERKIPLATIDIDESAAPGGTNISRIFSDDRAIGRTMAKHILSFGNFRSYGFF